MSRMESHVARDLVQARLVGAIFSSNVRSEIALKGGLAMRILAGSMRYTQDIDLAASPSVPKKTVASCIERAVAQLRSSGLVKDLRLYEKAKQTDVTQRWCVKGVIGSHEILLKVEVSRRQEVRSENVVKASYRPAQGLGEFEVSCVDLGTMAAGKFDCLQNLNREAPRDIYDLYVLVRMGVRPTRQAILSYGSEKLAGMRDLVWAKLEKMDYESVKAELLPWLPAEVARRFDEAAWDEMRYVVEEKVGQWIDDALAEGEPACPSGKSEEEGTYDRMAKVPA